MNSSHERVLDEVRRGEHRWTGQRSPDGKPILTYYDIGLLRSSLTHLYLDKSFDRRHLDRILDTLIARGHIVYRKSQRRYVAKSTGEQ